MNKVVGLDRASGRDLLGSGGGLAAERFRRRLLGGLDFGPGRGRWALDVGCGDGLEAVELVRRGWKVEAVDLEAHPCWASLRSTYRGSIRFRVASDKDLGRFQSSYALVFQKDVLHHVTEPLSLLKTLARLTAPGGELWMLECNRRNPVSYVHLTLLQGHQHFTMGRFRALATAAGLDGAIFWTREARVWPTESAVFQDAVDRLQDALGALPFWRHFAVYNLARWRRPARRAAGSRV
ncbi:MAG: class I SAM-dependent methyltransferase [bacterium]